MYTNSCSKLRHCLKRNSQKQSRNMLLDNKSHSSCKSYVPSLGKSFTYILDHRRLDVDASSKHKKSKRSMHIADIFPITNVKKESFGMLPLIPNKRRNISCFRERRIKWKFLNKKLSSIIHGVQYTDIDIPRNLSSIVPKKCVVKQKRTIIFPIKHIIE